MVLIIMLYKVFLTFISMDEILKSVTIQMKTTEQYFPVVLSTDYADPCCAGWFYLKSE